jgi:hypothetical protein
LEEKKKEEEEEEEEEILQSTSSSSEGKVNIETVSLNANSTTYHSIA